MLLIFVSEQIQEHAFSLRPKLRKHAVCFWRLLCAFITVSSTHKARTVHSEL